MDTKNYDENAEEINDKNNDIEIEENNDLDFRMVKQKKGVCCAIF